MTGHAEELLHHFNRPFITDIDLSILFKGSSNSRYSQVKRLLASKKLLHIRKGLYYLTEKLGNTIKAHPFELAQYIYGPSYISMESALSFHRLIPEAVYGISSVCIKRSKEFHTPFGLFSYNRLPIENFYTDVDLVIENNHRFFMAKPWKALCDYVYCHKENWDQLAHLCDSLRIEIDDLPTPRDEDIDRLGAYYQHRRVSRFLNVVKRDFKCYKRDANT